MSWSSNKGLFALIHVCVLSGCSDGETDGLRRGAQSARVTATDSALPILSSQRGDVRVVGDSSARGPRIDSTATGLLVRLPAAMARLLFDSLPAFSPLSNSGYDSGTVAWAVGIDPATQLLSAVLGDFDADGSKDIAMHGNFGDSTASVMILSNSSTAGLPRLLFFGSRPSRSHKTDYEVLLRRPDPSLILEAYGLSRDAVESVHIGKGAVVYFIDKGLLRGFDTAD